MEWVIGAIILAVLVSLAVGTWASYEIPKADGDELAADACAQCDRDKEWFDSQPGWYQALIYVWWLTNRALCTTKGC